MLEKYSTIDRRTDNRTLPTVSKIKPLVTQASVVFRINNQNQVECGCENHLLLTNLSHTHTRTHTIDKFALTVIIFIRLTRTV